MRRTSIVLTALLAAWPAAAHGQPRREFPPGRERRLSDPAEMVQQWYNHFLDRAPDRSGLNEWVRDLRRGRPPIEALAGLLSSDEYWRRTGRTTEGFVRGLLIDLTGQEPDRRAMREWVEYARGRKRVEVAQELLRRHERGWQGPAKAGDRYYYGNAAEEVRRLGEALEQLQQDFVIETEGRKQWGLYRQADGILADLRHLRRTLRSGGDRDHVYRHFVETDRKLHDLLKSAANVAGRRPGLSASVARVHRADNRLHYALNVGNDSRDRRGEVVRRQAESLALAAQALNRTAKYVLVNDPEGRHTEETIGRFEDAARHFLKSFAEAADREHLRRDFAAVSKEWAHATKDINNLGNRAGYHHLRRQAQEVDQIFQTVYQEIGLEGARPRVIYTLPTSR